MIIDIYIMTKCHKLMFLVMRVEEEEEDEQNSVS